MNCTCWNYGVCEMWARFNHSLWLLDIRRSDHDLLLLLTLETREGRPEYGIRCLVRVDDLLLLDRGGLMIPDCGIYILTLLLLLVEDMGWCWIMMRILSHG